VFVDEELPDDIVPIPVEEWLQQEFPEFKVIPHANDDDDDDDDDDEDDDDG
jgi:hypothetical protein